MLQTRHVPAPDALVLAPEVALARARAHEVTGSARVAFALFAAARTEGPVLWLQTDWGRERPMGDGLRAILDPGRLVFGRAAKAPDLLWATEEALRSGHVPLVVAELPAVPELTPVRRLHLAAEAGAAERRPPLALLLTPGNGGAPGVETRWRLDPAPGWARDGAPRWRLTRLRARMAPEATWDASLSGVRLRLDPVARDQADRDEWGSGRQGVPPGS
jgi:protein ImuA